MKKLVTFLLALLVASPVGIAAQPQKTGDDKNKAFSGSLDAFVEKTMQAVGDVPGLAIVVIKDDKPIFTKAYGMADKEANKKADADTLFYMGSTTKSFTAMVAAMLDKEGKMKLSDPVTKYTSGISFKYPMPDTITIRHLLTHTSGLNNGIMVHRTAYTGEIDKADIERVFAQVTRIDESIFDKYRYTNLGYNIYGLLLERNLNLKWQDELHKRIFDPVGLKHSTAYRSRAVAKKYSIAAPYIFDDQQGKIIRSPVDKVDNNMQAAGGHYMSINDLGRWLNLNMNGGKLGGKQVIPADILETVHTGYTKSTRNEPPFSGDGEYGLGWQIGKFRDDKVIYHHGGYSGYRSHVSYMPDRKIAVGVLVNNDVAGGRVADTVAAYAYDWWANRQDLDAEYAKIVDDFSKQYSNRKQQMMNSAAERAKRSSQLTQPLADYAGTYVDELLGTMEVTVSGNTLAFKMGNLIALATPFTEKDTVRIVMIPGGNGEVAGFVKGASGKFDTLRYAGREMKRLGS